MSSDRAVVVERDRRAEEPTPALEATPGGLAMGLGARLDGWHPVGAFIAVYVACYVVLATVSIALGFLIVDVVIPLDGIADADERLPDWLAARRTEVRNDASFYGSEVSGGIFLPILVGLIAIGFAIRKHWRHAIFLISALALESATYRTTVAFVDRRRPDVERLDQLPVEHSFPSGHVAASIAVFWGIAFLLTSRVHSRIARVAIWTFAIAITFVVGVSRMYRGMHHPLDELMGVLVGIAALVLAVFVARVTGVVAQRHQARKHSTLEPARAVS